MTRTNKAQTRRIKTTLECQNVGCSHRIELRLSKELAPSRCPGCGMGAYWTQVGARL